MAVKVQDVENEVHDRHGIEQGLGGLGDVHALLKAGEGRLVPGLQRDDFTAQDGPPAVQ